MNLEMRNKKKEKRSLERKRKALATYQEAVGETYGPTTSWIDKSKARENSEKMREGLLKGIDELSQELQIVNR